MYRLRRATTLLLLALSALRLTAQTNQPAPASPAPAKPAKLGKIPVNDVDPLALNVLKYVAQPLEQAQTFSFKARVSEEHLATNGQIVTLFHTVDVTAQRPDKVHMIFRGQGQTVDFYGESGKITRYAPQEKLYSYLPAKATINQTIGDLYAKGIDLPVGPFLRSDLYDIVAKTVTSGYVIGRAQIFGDDVNQVVFTSPDADFQIWVTGGDSPRFVRVEIVNKKLEGQPRTTIQFLDWNLNPAIAPDEFTFTKPADAHEISELPATKGK